MKRLSFFLGLSLLFISSCSSSQAVHKNKVEGGTHELVEAKADDKEIEEKIGSHSIDEEIPSSESFNIPSSNFLIPKNTKRMQFWVKYFIEKDRQRFQRFINNGEEYRYDIEEILESYGLPKELYFVGLIESGYYLSAKSRASAVGPWQFIRGTGKRYGLKISWEVDERQDLIKSTHAAAMYFRDLNNVFSSWELALSSYNAGEYGVLRRIMKHKTRDYYKLSKNKQLPTETINYVPKVLAAMHIVNNAEKYGFKIPRKNQKFFDSTELRPVSKNLSLRQIAKRLKISESLLTKLNPELKVRKTPRYYSGVYHLRVPKNVGHLLKAPVQTESRKAVIRRTAQNSEIHRVRRGDTLLGVARRYRTNAGKLARLNNLPSWKSDLRIGQLLKVSGSPTTSSPIVYRVHRGDNLSKLATLFRTNVSTIKRVNNLKNGRIYVGQNLILPNTKKGVYTVRRGDHLTKIARKFNQPLDAVIKLNSIRRGTIFPGQKLIVDID